MPGPVIEDAPSASSGEVRVEGDRRTGLLLLGVAAAVVVVFGLARLGGSDDRRAEPPATTATTAAPTTTAAVTTTPAPPTTSTVPAEVMVPAEVVALGPTGSTLVLRNLDTGELGLLDVDTGSIERRSTAQLGVRAPIASAVVAGDAVVVSTSSRSIYLLPHDLEGDAALFSDLFAAGFGKVILVGSDLPTLPMSHLQQAMALTTPGTAVLGPSADGGYYLLGLAATGDGVPDLFTGIRWSTSAALDDTVAAAKKAGLQVTLVPPWYDVDDANGLTRLRRDLDDPIVRARAPATADTLAAIESGLPAQ